MKGKNKDKIFNWFYLPLLNILNLKSLIYISYFWLYEDNLSFPDECKVYTKMKKILESKVMQKFLIVAFICFLLIGVGRVLLDVFKQEPFDYQNILIIAMSFFFILSYINKLSEKEDKWN